MIKYLYTIGAKNKPYITDENTQYDVTKCPKCGSGKTEIKELGAYLPYYGEMFGLIWQSGLIGTQSSIDFLLSQGINLFTTERAKITFNIKYKSLIVGNFYWIKPNTVLTLDTDNGPGPVVVCKICGRRSWEGKNLKLPRFNEKIESDFFLIKDTWINIVSEKFVDVAKKVPNGCFLDFEHWYYEEKEN